MANNGKLLLMERKNFLSKPNPFKAFSVQIQHVWPSTHPANVFFPFIFFTKPTFFVRIHQLLLVELKINIILFEKKIMIIIVF